MKVYETNTPLAYYSISDKQPQNILILENCDPYYGMRHHLMSGKTTIFGVEIDTIVYGAGKGVSKSMRDLERCCSSYLSNKDNNYFYYGDLDYEGIQIYVDLKRDMKEDFDSNFDLKPFKEAYIKMLDASDNRSLPLTKEGQTSSERDNEFFSHFNDEIAEKMKGILEKREYIPQEILNISDY